MKWALGLLAGLLLVAAIIYVGFTVGQKLDAVGGKLDALAAEVGSYNEPALAEKDVIGIVQGYLLSKVESLVVGDERRGYVLASALGDEEEWTATPLGQRVWRVNRSIPSGGNLTHDEEAAYVFWGGFLFDEKTFTLKHLSSP